LLSYDQIGGNSVATPIDYGAGRFLTGALIRPVDGPANNAEKSNALFQIIEDNRAITLKRVWYAERARGSFSSPVTNGQKAFWINPQGVIYGVDLETGAELFSKRLDCGGCWATPILWKNKIFCFGKEGKVQVLQVEPDLQSVATIDSIWSDVETTTPATLYSALPIENGFLIRTGNGLYRISVQPQ